MGLARKQVGTFLPWSTHNRWVLGATLARFGHFWLFWAVLGSVHSKSIFAKNDP